LTGKTKFFLKHVVTNKYLYVDILRSMYNDNNCRGCQIIGYREASCKNDKDRQSLWKIKGGVIFNEIAGENN
jgi:hypothetical protein